MKKTNLPKRKWLKPEVQVLKINIETSSSMKKKAVEMVNMSGMLQPC